MARVALSGEARLSRRTALAYGAAAVSGLTWLGGCALTRGFGHVRASPSPTGQVQTLVIGLPAITGTVRGSTIQQLINTALEPFVQEHHGVRIQQASYPGQATTQLLSALAAGTGPDVLANSVMPPFVSSGFLLDLGPYIREESVDLSVFPAGMLDYFASSATVSPTNPQGMYGLPLDMDQRAYVVNLSALDSLGLGYPDASWTYEQYGNLFVRASAPAFGTTPQRYGGMLISRLRLFAQHAVPLRTSRLG